MTNLIYELPEYDSQVAKKVNLTDAQEELWYLKSEMGLTDAQIAKRKGVRDRSVSNLRKKVYKKLEFADSPGILNTAGEMGIDPSNISHGWHKSDEGSYFFKRDTINDMTQDELLEVIKEAFKTDIEKPKPVYLGPKDNDSNLLTKYVLADLHLGMFAWAEESGEDYDLDIAESTVKGAINKLIDSTPRSETALILNLGDYFHNNDAKGMTPLSGHILDMDTRFAKIASVGIRVIRYILEKTAEKHGKVRYIAVPGNHDPDQSVWLTLALIEAYRNHPNIEIVWNPAPFFVYQHGQNMIAAHHGDRTNFQRLVLTMGENHSKVWGNTYWRFLDTGHVHHQREHEIGGVLCRSYRTLSAKDAFASKGGYTAKRSITAQTYDKNLGEILVNNVNLFGSGKGRHNEFIDE